MHKTGPRRYTFELVTRHTPMSSFPASNACSRRGSSGSCSDSPQHTIDITTTTGGWVEPIPERIQVEDSDQDQTESEAVAFEAEHSSQVQSHLCELLDSGKHSDVTFTIGSGDEMVKIPAHRIVLASQSQYFDRLLFGEMAEAHAGAEIPLQDTSLEAFRLLLKYIYSGRMRIDHSNLLLKLEVLQLADRFDFGFLKNTFDLYLSSTVNSSNVLRVFVHADLLHLEETTMACMSYIDCNAQLILQGEDLLELPMHLFKRIISRDTFLIREINIFHAVHKWLQHNKKGRGEADDLVGSVRLCEIHPQELFDEVDPSGLFDREAIFDAMKIQQKPNWEATLPRGRIYDGNLFDNVKTSCQYSSESKANPHWMEGHSSSTWGIKVGGNYFDLSESSSNPRFGACTRHPPTSVLIKFPDIYLLNHIMLHLLAPVTYNIHISNDNKQWRKLIDYSMFTCSGEQQLYFPKQAVRYIHFSPNSEDKDCRVKLSSCSLDEAIPQFSLRDGGILAPLKPFAPLIVQSSRRNRHGLPLCQITFKQPYCVSAMRFNLMGTGTTREGDKVEGTVVIYTLAGKGSHYTQVANLSDHDIFFGSEVQVKFAERITTHVSVMLKGSSDSPGPSKRMKLEDSSNGTGAIPVDIISQDFTISGLMCWADE